MAALTGNSVGTSYQGLLKTSDNAAISGVLKNMTDGAGNATPLSMANNYLQVQAPTIEFVESTGGTNLMMISPANVYFEGAVDFTNATLTGLPGGAPGLVNSTLGIDTFISAAALSTLPAQADSAGNIAIGNNARALGGGGFERTNISLGNGLTSGERSIGIGHAVNAIGGRSVAMSENANASNLRSVAIGQNSQSTGFNSFVGGAYSRATAEGAFAVGGYNAWALNLYSGALGRESTANLDGAVAIGYQVTSAWAYATTVNQLAIQNYVAINYADDTAAAVGGVPLGGVYHTSGAMKIRTV